MLDNAMSGYGAILSLGTEATPPIYESVAGITSVTPPGVKIDTEESTELTAPGAYKQFIAGLIDGGECQLEGNFLGKTASTGYAKLVTTAKARKVVNCKIASDDTEDPEYSFTFPGLITEVQVGKIEPGKKIQFTAKIKVAGEVTEA